MTKLWFITDIHGSNICFRKFINAARITENPDVLILGGDITGKYLVPIEKSSKGQWIASFEGYTHRFPDNKTANDFLSVLGDKGVYGILCEPELALQIRSDPSVQDRIIKELKVNRIKEWVEMADERLKGLNKKIFVNTGNDDPFYIDEFLGRSLPIIQPEGKLVEIDDQITMVSTGFSNLTPWNCPRDISETDLRVKIDSMVKGIPDFSRCIFNFHCPPYGTVLDRTIKLDENLRASITGYGVEEASVGSHAVRSAIEDYQPIVSLHGHIHDQHTYEKIGRTLCFNPGSEYSLGLLRGVYLEFIGGELKYYQLTREMIKK